MFVILNYFALLISFSSCGSSNRSISTAQSKQETRHSYKTKDPSVRTIFATLLLEENTAIALKSWDKNYDIKNLSKVFDEDVFKKSSLNLSIAQVIKFLTITQKEYEEINKEYPDFSKTDKSFQNVFVRCKDLLTFLKSDSIDPNMKFKIFYKNIKSAEAVEVAKRQRAKLDEDMKDFVRIHIRKFYENRQTSYNEPLKPNSYWENLTELDWIALEKKYKEDHTLLERRGYLKIETERLIQKAWGLIAITSEKFWDNLSSSQMDRLQKNIDTYKAGGFPSLIICCPMDLLYADEDKSNHPHNCFEYMK